MAADLDLLDPPPLTVVAGGESFAVLPLRLRALPAVVRALAGVRLSADLDLVALMQAHGEQVLTAAALASGIGIERIAAFEPAEALDLVRAVLEANASMFEPPVSVERGKALDWIDAVTRLVAHGHRYPELLDYTVPQCRAFLRAIERMERSRARIDLMVARGSQATREGFDSVWSAFDDD